MECVLESSSAVLFYMGLQESRPIKCVKRASN